MNHIADLLKNAQEAFKKQNLDEAEKHLLDVLNKEPSNVTANYLTGLIASSQLKNAKALKYLGTAASLCNDDPKIFYNYGMVLQRTAKYGKAATQYEKALSLNPDNIPALNNYSAIMFIMGNIKKAEEAARKIIEINPTHIDPYINLGNSLKDQGRIDEAIESYKTALTIKPDHAIAGSNLLLCLNYSNRAPETIFDEHKKWEDRIKPTILVKNHQKAKLAPEKRPLRIGYVSADFRTHSVAYYIEPILESHDRSQFEVYCYSDVRMIDPVTLRIIKLPLTWRPIHEKDNNQVVDIILKDEIDILVDLAGHAGNKRLSIFLNKLAPVQVTYLGYANTTGLSTIDYRLTDEWADPDGSDIFYTERLYRIPNGFLCYKPPLNPPPINESPVLNNGYITFGSFNNLPKISSHTIKVWSQILKTIPHSKLMVKTKPFNDTLIQKHYKNLFLRNGIEAERLIFTGYSPSLEKHLSSYSDIDIALDTFPYNGTTTTCEALLMGVPVITLAGKSHAGRVGVSLLSSIGLTGMIAESEEKYVAIASFLTSDIPRLSKFRIGLRTALLQSPICDGKSFTQRLENVYKDIWMKFVESGK